MFISFEGIEGAGKSTQIKRLATYLESLGNEVLVTFEPGATHFGASLRKVLLDPETRLTDPVSETCLFIADRLEHIAQVIKPALERDVVVLTDRFLDSTFAYQCGGRQVPKSLLAPLFDLISIRPDLTVLLDTDPNEGLRRAKARAALDRFEQEELSFHERVRESFLEIAKNDTNRVHVTHVDGLSIDEVFESVKIVIDEKLKRRRSDESNC